MRRFSEACERNRSPILSVLARVFADRRLVLEIGSGTGQHAVYLGAALSQLTWQPSDLPEWHGGIRAWLAGSPATNVRPPLVLDVRAPDWKVEQFDAAFSANVVHIISWAAVESMFQSIGRHRSSDCVLALYGPFNYRGCFTAQSNARFDAWLRLRDPASGIRDFEALDQLARAIGLRLWEDNPMPANNRLGVWRG